MVVARRSRPLPPAATLQPEAADEANRVSLAARWRPDVRPAAVAAALPRQARGRESPSGRWLLPAHRKRKREGGNWEKKVAGRNEN